MDQKKNDAMEQCYFCKKICTKDYMCVSCGFSFCGQCPQTVYQHTLNGIIDREDICLWCVKKGCRKQMRRKEKNKKKTYEQLTMRKEKKMDQRRQEWLKKKEGDEKKVKEVLRRGYF
jgi:hypothetical protein